ncbi:hypothetical protein BH10BAC3_BH10BAC3_37650 [soil metagenome]
MAAKYYLNHIAGTCNSFDLYGNFYFMKKCRHLSFILLLLLSLLFIDGFTQGAKENTADLSKAAHKGMLTDAVITSEGLLNFTYGMQVEKKSENLQYEDYTFDKDLAFKGMQASKVAKEDRPDKNVINLYAYAGGTSSFNVLSQKLSLQREEWINTWNRKKQKYELGKRISKETVKPKNDEGKYLGYVTYSAGEGEGAFILSSYQPDKKGADDIFQALFIDMDLNIKATPIITDGDYSLVYSGQLENDNIFVIMAPHKKMPNTSQYIYAEFTPKAELVKRSFFTSPSPNLLIMDYREVNGSLFLCAGSTKENDAYNEVFPNYVTIGNPATGLSYHGGKYNQEAYKRELANFHLLKFTKGDLAFATVVPIKSFKDKVVTPPSQRKAHTYEGKRLLIEEFKVLPDGGYLMAGQLLDKDVVKDVQVTKYLDIVGFLFDANGGLRAQFAVEKMNDDTKSEIWPSDQNFYISTDGKTAYWEILEVKGAKGYESFADAYNGNKTYTFSYFPRIAKINLAATTISEFDVLGSNGKYQMYKQHAALTSADGKTRYYLGHDEDYEKVWIGKYSFQ